jgi:solute carrier family 25 carnitine/acylcarnitine transporter 20/29
MTISIVRTISFTIYTSSKRIINATPSDPTTSANPWLDVRLGLFNSKKISDVAITSGLAGAASGAVVCLGSAPFELVKVRLGRIFS